MLLFKLAESADSLVVSLPEGVIDASVGWDGDRTAFESDVFEWVQGNTPYTLASTLDMFRMSLSQRGVDVLTAMTGTWGAEDSLNKLYLAVYSEQWSVLGSIPVFTKQGQQILPSRWSSGWLHETMLEWLFLKGSPLFVPVWHKESLRLWDADFDDMGTLLGVHCVWRPALAPKSFDSSFFTQLWDSGKVTLLNRAAFLPKKWRI